LTAGFGAQTVLHGIDLEVEPASVTGIFGLNGAGKSVLLKVIAGVVPARAGSVHLDGADVTRWSPERRVAAGMAHVPQGRQVFRTLSVEANLRVGAYTLCRAERHTIADRLDRAYATFPMLASRRRQAAGTLSGGQQAALAVARALICDPALVLIDEPSAGLAPAVVEELLETLLAVRAGGVTMLLVEQNIRFGLRLADHAVLLQRGRAVFGGATHDLDQDALAEHLGVGRLLGRELAAGLGKKAKPRATRANKPAPRKAAGRTSAAV
jgi:branched-chain amino acid transport system ATP-binding protein